MSQIGTLDERLPTPATRAKAAAIVAFDAAEDIARRIRDPEALQKALDGKLDAQRDFAAEYKFRFPQGAAPAKHSGKGGKDDTSVVLTGEAYCSAHGFHQRTVQRWLELLEEMKLAEKKEIVRKKCWALAELWQAANFMSESVEWYTPAQYVKAVRDVLGEIDLDPASSEQANSAVGAKQYFTEQQNGLAQTWHGNFFMNPPYGKTADGKSLAAEFCNKAIDEYSCGNVSAGIILVNSLHSQAWQAPLYEHAICFVNHRIQFVSADGEENKNPTFQNIFIYLGNELEKFAEAFSGFGYVMVRYGRGI